MAQLFEEQQDTDKLVDYTHFDAWFWDDEDEYEAEHRVHGALHDNFNDTVKVAALAQEVIQEWDKTLGTSIVHSLRSNFGTVQRALILVGQDHFWDLVIMHLLRKGYDVFEGSTFIEVYSAEGAEETT